MERNVALMGKAEVWTSARHVIFSLLFVPYFCLSLITQADPFSVPAIRCLLLLSVPTQLCVRKLAVLPE